MRWMQPAHYELPKTRTIYTEVISKICRYLLHPFVIDPIKECLQPFKSEVSPIIDCAPSPPSIPT
jgi:hypothetical protein